MRARNIHYLSPLLSTLNVGRVSHLNTELNNSASQLAAGPPASESLLVSTEIAGKPAWHLCDTRDPSLVFKLTQRVFDPLGHLLSLFADILSPPTGYKIQRDLPHRTRSTTRYHSTSHRKMVRHPRTPRHKFHRRVPILM